MPLPVRELFNNEQNIHLQFVAGDGGLNRQIGSPEIVRPVDAFAAEAVPGPSVRKSRSAHRRGGLRPRVDKIVRIATRHIQDHIWVIGMLEMAALLTGPPGFRRRFLEFLKRIHPAGVVFTDGLSPTKLDADLIRQTSIPIFTSRLPYTRFVAGFHTFMENCLAPHTTVHGTMITLFGQGVLLQGPSSVGKSEIALALIERAHRLVADDTVQIRLAQSRQLIGSAPDLGRHHMEIRGLGILNIRQLYGVAAIVDEHPVSLVVELIAGSSVRRREERLGSLRTKRILGVEVPRVVVQVRTGRHMAVIVEAAARNQRLRTTGYDTLGNFQRNLDRRLMQGKAAH